MVHVGRFVCFFWDGLWSHETTHQALVLRIALAHSSQLVCHIYAGPLHTESVGYHFFTGVCVCVDIMHATTVTTTSTGWCVQACLSLSFPRSVWSHGPWPLHAKGPTGTFEPKTTR